MSDDLPSYARALQSRKKKENQGNLMDDNYDDTCFYSSQSRNSQYRNEKPNFDSDYQTRQQYQNYDDSQTRRIKRQDYDYNQNVDFNYNDQYKERSSRHTRKRRSQPTYVQNSPQQLMQPQYQQYNQQQQYQQPYPQQYNQQNQKSQTHRKRSFPTDKIDITCSPNIPEQQPYEDNFVQNTAKPAQTTKEPNYNEVNTKMIAELQQKNRDLITEIRALKTVRNDEEINELRVALQTQKNRNAQLFQDLQNSENQVADTKQLLSLKDTTIQNLQDECQKLRIEYQDLLASIRIQNDQIAQLSRRNRELEIEIERTKLAQQCYGINQSMPFGMNNNFSLNPQLGTQRFFDNNTNNISQMKTIPDRNVNSVTPSGSANIPPQTTDSNLLTVPPSTYSIQPKGNVHPAMKDNLFFEEPPKKADDLNVQNLTDDELREKYKHYTQLKDSKNWILSRAAPKGANFSHVRQEKEKLADECDELARICSKIKLEMKLRGIF